MKTVKGFQDLKKGKTFYDERTARYLEYREKWNKQLAHFYEYGLDEENNEYLADAKVLLTEAEVQRLKAW